MMVRFVFLVCIALLVPIQMHFAEIHGKIIKKSRFAIVLRQLLGGVENVSNIVQ
jgi:hypothetical protein